MDSTSLADDYAFLTEWLEPLIADHTGNIISTTVGTRRTILLVHQFPCRHLVDQKKPMNEIRGASAEQAVMTAVDAVFCALGDRLVEAVSAGAKKLNAAG